MGTVKKQKRARSSALKNRYCAGAKLSEHKFLRILRGFAEGMTLSALDSMTRISSKTIRATYRLFRARLAEAVLDDADAFGRAGFYLSQPSASELLNAIAASAVFRRYRKLHAPRLKDERDVRLLVLEFAVRVFCAVDLRAVRISNEEVLTAIVTSLRALRPRDPLQKLAEYISGARPHAHGGGRIFEELSRNLRQSPLGKAPANLGAEKESCPRTPCPPDANRKFLMFV